MMMIQKLSIAAAPAVVVAALSVPAQAALVLHYEFENDSTAAGGITDTSGNSRNGSVLTTGAGPTGGFSADTPTGSGKSLSLTPGSGQAAYVSSDSPGYMGVTGNNPFTAAAWIKTSADADQNIFSWGNTGNSNGTLLRFRTDEVGSTGVFAGRVEVQGFGQTGTVDLTTGEWIHVAAVFAGGDNGTFTLYVNGVQDFSTASTVTVNISEISNVLIGRRHDGSTLNAFNGLIDDARLYNEALTAQQVAALVPEPASLALVGLGMLAMLRRRTV